MGKKRSAESPKASKKETNQSNSMFKVLRPKVYIIDSSSFKGLVQELTGNGRSIPSPLPSNPRAAVNNNDVKVMHVEDCEDPETNTGGSTSFDSPIDPFEFYNQLSILEEMNHPQSQMNFDDTASDSSLSPLSQPVDMLASQYFETFLLSDIQQNPFFNGFYQYHQEEVSICDYEFSGLD